MFSLEEETGLDDQTREDLIRVLEKRARYLEAEAQLCSMRVRHLRDPEVVSLEDIQLYVSSKVKPLERAYKRSLRETFTRDRLKELFPQLLRSVVAEPDNLKKVLRFMGADDEVISTSLSQLRRRIGL